MKAWRHSLLVVVLLSGGVARACSCMAPPPCGLGHPRGEVFLGKVVSSGMVEWLRQAVQGRTERERRQVRLVVLESFSGKQRVGDEVVVETGWGGGDCGYPFQDGGRYLVYASNFRGRLSTSICSETGSETEKRKLLQELRTNVAGGRLNDVEGVLQTQAGVGSETSPKLQMTGVAVTLTPVGGGKSLHATTDASGAYTLPFVPAGKYLFTADLPKDVAIDQLFGDTWKGAPAKIEIPAGQGGAGCHYRMFVRPSGSISGVVNTEGKQSGRKEVFVALMNPSFQIIAFPATEDDGRFTVRFIAPGTYYMEFFTNGGWEHPWYYPGVNSKTEAKAIVVREGEQVAGIHLVLPAR